MTLPAVVISQLDQHQISYELLTADQPKSYYKDAAKLGIDKSQLLRSVVIEALGKQFMLVLVASDLLDFNSLNAKYGESVKVANSFKSTITGTDASAKLAINDLQSIDVILDKQIQTHDTIYIDSGIAGSFIKLSSSDFIKLQGNAIIEEFACPAEKLFRVRHASDDESNSLKIFTPKRIQQRVEETFDLPPMPALAQEIMRLRVDPKAGANELAQVVSKDPSLAAQLISWASSPYYGYQGKIDSIETAISRVLGFDLVLNLALGISVGKSLNVPHEGPLGLENYWKQSVYNATLAEKLCSFIQSKDRPQRGLVYLSGLLHNFGQLVLGHLFPPQFYLLNRYVAMNPHIPVVDIEHYLLGVSHVEIGSWLMESWNMPEEVTSAVRWHHEESHNAPHAIYPSIVMLSNRLLKRISVGDSPSEVLPDDILAHVGIDYEDAFRALDQIAETETELNNIARQMVA